MTVSDYCNGFYVVNIFPCYLVKISFQILIIFVGVYTLYVLILLPNQYVLRNFDLAMIKVLDNLT